MSYRLNIVSTLILCAQLIAHSQGSIRDTLSLDAGFWSSTYLVGTREVTREEFEGILKSASDTTICAAYQAGKSEAVTANSLYMLGACGVAVGIATKPAPSIVAFNPAGMIALADEIDSTLAAGIKQNQQVLAALARLVRAAPKEGTFVPAGF